jgi:hypothetical protein
LNEDIIKLRVSDLLYKEGVPKGSELRPINMWASHLLLFSIALSFFESELESHGFTARMIRDQDSVHGEALDYVYDFMVKGFPLKNLVGCGENISADSIGLQLADLLAGAIERVLRAKSYKANLAQINQTIWVNLRLSIALGKWTYQLTSDSCELALKNLWDYKTLPQLNPSETINPNNPLRCNCGGVIIGEESAFRKKPREQFQVMLEDARRGKFDVLVVWSMDRFK